MSAKTRILGFRVSLGHLCEANLGEGKSGDGLQSLRWWKDGRIDLIEQYCRKDVELTLTGGAVVSRPYIDVTLEIMRAFGAELLAGDPT